MCNQCKKKGKCAVACYPLYNLPRKKRTPEEEQLVRDYDSYARDETRY
jgi:hypothetical protein